MKITGIYKITNITNGHFYIGSSIDIHTRWYHHKRNSRKGSIKCPHLYSAIRKYGEKNFTCDCLLICEQKDLELYEQLLLDLYFGTPECYNVSPNAKAPWRGRKMTSEQKKKISESMKGRKAWNKGIPRTEEEKQTISQRTKEAMSTYDVVVSESTRQKLSKKLKGRVFSKDSREKMRLAKVNYVPWNKGKTGYKCKKSTQ